MSPVVEFSAHTQNGQPLVLSKDKKYSLQLPQIIEDVKAAKENINIWSGNIHTDDITLSNGSKDSDVIHDSDNKYINIETTTLGTFIVTVDEINCCARSAMIHLFGSLKNTPSEKPLASVNVYFSNLFYRFQEYEMVSTFFEDLQLPTVASVVTGKHTPP